MKNNDFDIKKLVVNKGILATGILSLMLAATGCSPKALNDSEPSSSIEEISTEATTELKKTEEESTKVPDTEEITTEMEPINDHMLKDVKVGEDVVFGSYEQDGLADNGLEPITWKVLDIKDGYAVLISKEGLDCKKFHESVEEGIKWDNSDIRLWLNNEFAKQAFSSAEKECIVKNYMGDQVSLLTAEQASSLFSSDEDRRCHITEYARNLGAGITDGPEPEEVVEYSSWWLRSPGFADGFIAYVTSSGSVVTNQGDAMNYPFNTVRPVIQVLVSKDTNENNEDSGVDSTVAGLSIDENGITKYDKAFYGIWCYAATSDADAIKFAKEMSANGLTGYVYVTTDWENLNSDTYYVVTAGMYATEEEAKEALLKVQAAGYKDAYVKYTGERKIS